MGLVISYFFHALFYLYVMEKNAYFSCLKLTGFSGDLFVLFSFIIPYPFSLCMEEPFVLPC